MSATRKTERRSGLGPAGARRSRGPRNGLRAAALAVLLGAAPLTTAQPDPGDVFDLAHPTVRAFSDRDGLPQNTVHAITRDPLGYLWVGTQDGAARWNGREWTTIDMPDRDVSNFIRSVVATRQPTIRRANTSMTNAT